ncbi:YybH family protein [Streptomyces poriticola]|uniref:YybH family protein n=1 Tax=Streptomyces poriticola TaxID=3120506 RepID=UPI002FCE528C
MEPIEVVERFNAAINRRDLADIAALMSEDHAFVDSAGGAVRGKQACVEAWRGFFAAFPDYRNVFTDLTAREQVVTASGYSVCSHPDLSGPARWTARVRGDLVTEWRVSDAVT